MKTVPLTRAQLVKFWTLALGGLCLIAALVMFVCVKLGTRGEGDVGTRGEGDDREADRKIDLEETRQAERRVRSARKAESQGKRTLALGHYEAALEIYERLRRRSPSSSRYRFKVAELKLHTGELHRKLGVRNSAKDDFDDARRMLEELCELDAGNAEWKRYLAEADHNLGIISADRGQHAEALKSYRRALDLRKKALRLKAGLDGDLDSHSEWADLADDPDTTS